MDCTTIRVLFVIPQNSDSGQDPSEVMQQAFQICKQNIKTVDWIHENDNSTDFSKTDFIVFENFDGEYFEMVSSTYKSVRIVGPMCLLVCLVEGKPVPNFTWPIFNVAMSSCIITSSSIPKEEKKEIKHKVQTMGGLYVDGLISKCTHLITGSVKSEKYILAAQEGIKLMVSSWIDDVWQESQKRNIHATDDEFNIHKCGPFLGLTICATGISSSVEKQNLEKLISSNGGKYSPALHVSKTDILICEGVVATISAKYKAARKSDNVKCVTLQWVYDSVERGYALDHMSYAVKKGTSTPTKDTENVDPNFSVMSAIHHSNMVSTIQESVINVSTLLMHENNTTDLKRKEPTKTLYGDLVDKMDIKKAKTAGAFLDDCSVYLAGFSAEQKEKLSKILNFSGSTRYNELSERITHIIVGDPNCLEIKLIKSRGFDAILVSAQWLFDSIEKQQPVPEERYVIVPPASSQSGCSSPLSKKGLSLLRTNNTKIEEEEAQMMKIDTQDSQQTENEINYIKKYLQFDNASQDSLVKQMEADELANNKSERDANTTVRVPNQSNEQSTFVAGSDIKCPNKEALESSHSNEQSKDDNIKVPKDSVSSKQLLAPFTSRNCSAYTEGYSTQAIDLFEGLKFLIAGFEEGGQEQLKNYIEAMGGTVVTEAFKGVSDYAVVPTFGFKLRLSASEIVNDKWILECYKRKQLCEVMYYHQPVAIQENKEAFKDCVITLSSYKDYERDFLKHLALNLGAVVQDQLARSAVPDKNILKTTHLVSLEASGKKYISSVKWKTPVVNKDWLLECAKLGKLLPEQNFLVGNSVATERSINVANIIGTTSLDCMTKSSVKANNTESVNKTPLGYKSYMMETPGISHPSTSKQTASARTPTTSEFPSNPSVPSTLSQKKSTPEPTTPVNRVLNFRDDTPQQCSQVTPVNKIMEKFRSNNFGDGPPTPKAITHIGTPETPLGAYIHPNPSPNLRKEMVAYLNGFPDWKPPRKRRYSTPLSEIKRKLWENICPSQGSQEERTEPEEPNINPADEENTTDPGADTSNKETPKSMLINEKLKQLEEMVSASGGSRRSSVRKALEHVPDPVPYTVEQKESQAYTVGWDYMECVDANQDQQKNNTSKVFMLSGISTELRRMVTDQLQQFDVAVSELSSYDPTATHMVCPKPTRNEKTLACMAAGKWVLHISYIEESVKAGQLLDEELFEFGNPKASNIAGNFNNENEQRMQAMYWWRKEITKRGYGAFHDMRAIVVSNKPEPIIRVIAAGGGMVVNVVPPFDDSVYATHCLLETKNVPDLSVYVPLAKQGIYCVNTLYISEFLHRVSKDIRDCVIPYFSKHYARI